MEIKAKGIRIDANSTPEQLAAALKAAPQLSEYIEVETPKTAKKDVKE